MKIKNKKFEIEFIGDTQLKKFLRDSKDRLKKLSEYFQILHQNEDQTMITIKIVSNEEIKILNKEFRKKNKSTDILSFPFKKNLKISNQTYIGDIIISYNFIDKPKSQTIKIFRGKLIKTCIHGFLHLLNFDHIKNKDYKKMLKEEKFIYQSVISKLDKVE